ncbi:MAG: NADH-quinone oxidoreductase subunit L, partial [Burkholderiales bacterium]|nr:NADH-quinone oxidoreductase subunit L [Burkholderiales bacterium]
FLGAGSVIMGMHHDQDIRNMGGLRRYMPITWITSLLGSLALIGTPLFAGFYSKDSIIEAVGLTHLPGTPFAVFAVTASVFVTAFYSFRMYFLVFHGPERFRHKPHPPEAHGDDAQGHADQGQHADPANHGVHGDHGAHGSHEAHDATPHESPWVVTAPLVLLAIPSVLIGFLTIGPMLYGSFFADSIFVDSTAHPAMKRLAEEYHGPSAMALHALAGLPFWLALAGVATAAWFYLLQPSIPAALARRFAPLMRLLQNKYYLDWFNEHVLAAGARAVGRFLWRRGDVGLIDGALVDGSAGMVRRFAGVVRQAQSGHLYQYALVMVLGIFGLLTWTLWPYLGALMR